MAGVRSALAPALGSGDRGNAQRSHRNEADDHEGAFPDHSGRIWLLRDKGLRGGRRPGPISGESAWCSPDRTTHPSNGEERRRPRATIANTNIKVAMKIEEHDTFALFEKRAGQAHTTSVSGVEKASMGQSFRMGEGAKLGKENRVNLRDMVSQKPGEAHIIFGDALVRGKLCYFKPEKISAEMKNAAVNKFLQVPDITGDMRREMIAKNKCLAPETRQGQRGRRGVRRERNNLIWTRPSNAWFDDFAWGMAEDLSMMQASRFCIGLSARRKALAERAEEDYEDEGGMMSMEDEGFVEDEEDLLPPPGSAFTSSGEKEDEEHAERMGEAYAGTARREVLSMGRRPPNDGFDGEDMEEESAIGSERLRSRRSAFLARPARPVPRRADEKASRKGAEGPRGASIQRSASATSCET